MTETMTIPAIRQRDEAQAAWSAYNAIALQRGLSVSTRLSEERRANIEKCLKTGGIENWRRAVKALARQPQVKLGPNGLPVPYSIDDLMTKGMWTELNGGPKRKIIVRNRPSKAKAPSAARQVTWDDLPIIDPPSKRTSALAGLFGWITGRAA